MLFSPQTSRFINWLRGTISLKPTPRRHSPQIDPLRQWGWVLAKPFGSFNPEHPPGAQTLTWFIPPVGRGSGGHLNLFRFIDMLERRGFDCRIVVCHEPRPVSADAIRREITEWFFPLKAPVYLHPAEEIPPSHIAIATGWQTAYPVKAFKGCRQALYFVQDFEPWFQGVGSVAAFAEATYRFGFPAITAGDWLANLLREKYGMQTFSVGFGVDHNLYFPQPAAATKDGRHVFFYARPPTERRGFELGMLALRRLSELLPDVTVHFAGWPMDRYVIPFRHVDHGILPLDRLAALYSRCDAALVFSFSNVSLLPLEIMACGCPVVSNGGANVEWLLKPDIALLVASEPDAVAEGLLRVLTDRELHQRLASAGIRAAIASSWEHEGDRMARIIKDMNVKACNNFSVLE